MPARLRCVQPAPIEQPGRSSHQERTAMIHAVLHDAKDTVAVAVVEGLKAGTELNAWIMDEDKIIQLKALQDIPIGHKVALKTWRSATPCSSTASTSARWSNPSRPASTPTCTTSRPSAGKRRAVHLPHTQIHRHRNRHGHRQCFDHLPGIPPR